VCVCVCVCVCVYTGVGLTSNLELLANRGALVARNPSNFVLMKFQLDSASDMHFSAREAMMRQLNLSNPMTYVVCVCVSVCVCERERECVCVCVYYIRIDCS
jgi:hypothetical protein